MSDEPAGGDGTVAASPWSGVHQDWLDAIRARAIGMRRAIFGDRVGLVIWLGLVLALAILWRVGIFITDSYTIANTLANVADGHLAITHVEYSLTVGSQPGLHQYEGVLYGRNYGQAFFALPFLWLLQGASALADPRFVLLGGWAVGALAFARQLGRLFGRRSTLAIAGSCLAVVTVLTGVVVGTPLPDDHLALTALQMTTLFAAATVGLLAYRLLALFEGRTVGVAAGVAAGLATPIGFWATIPKRHVLVAALAMAAVYCFARSRRDQDLRFRAGAYAFAGLVAWIHAFEGFFLVLAIGGVDLATARDNGWRELAAVALVLLLALAPTFATNAAITGNPMQSPRLLPGVGVGDVELAPGGPLSAETPESGVGGAVGDGASGGTGDGQTPPGGPVGWLFGLFGVVLALLPRPSDAVVLIGSFVIGTVVDGLAALADPGRLWHVFVRSGHVPGVRYAMNQYEVIELTVLESMPLLGALAALPVAAAVKLRRHGRDALRWPRSASPARQTDLLVGTVAVVFVVIYLSRLPLFATLTVRYLLPIYPLGLYAVARLAPVSTAVDESPRAVVGAYAGTLVLGATLGTAVLGVIDPALGEAVQVHALVNLAAATALAIAVTGRLLAPEAIGSRSVAAALGVAAGATTLYVALAGLSYFAYGPHALDAARVVADLLGSLA